MNLLVKNGRVFTAEGKFKRMNILISAGHILALSEDAFKDDELMDYETIDADGLWVIPGLVDIHTHGAYGFDYCNASKEEVLKITSYERKHGITAVCPTSMTFNEDILKQIFTKLSDIAHLNKHLPDSQNDLSSSHARIIGINMEGPFLSLSKAGAQNPLYITTPDISMFKRLQEASDNSIRLLTIAPEELTDMSFITELKDSVHISFGHSCADYDTALRGYLLGADHLTHAFNAMTPFSHKEPGLIGAAIEQPHVYAELICDLQHVHPSVIKSTFKMFGSDRVVAISDSMEATGMEDGLYHLGDVEVFKKSNTAITKEGALAGSVTNLFDAFKNLINIGIPLEEAIKAVTVNPAKSIGMNDLVGTIKEGAFADLLLLNDNLDIIRII